MQDDVAHRRIGALLDYDEFQRAAVRVGVLNALCAAVQGQLMSHRLGERVLLTVAQGMTTPTTVVIWSFFRGLVIFFLKLISGTLFFFSSVKPKKKMQRGGLSEGVDISVSTPVHRRFGRCP